MSKNGNSEYVPIKDYKYTIYTNMASVRDYIEELQEDALIFENDSQHLSTLQSQLLKTRKAYKSVEYILEYFYPEHVKEYINGPPLDHIDPNPIQEKYNAKTYYNVTPNEYMENLPLDYRDKSHFRGEASVIPPIGLQVLDELIFSDHPEGEKDKILTLIQKLQRDFRTLESAIKKRKYIADFEVMEASRLQLIRIFSMGITGFDTPGSLNAIKEATASLKALQEILQPLLIKEPDTQQKIISQLFNNSMGYLNRNPNFNTFDRLTFLKSYINPLYANLLIVQKDLSILSSDDRYIKTPSWNAYSENIFSEDFLNPYYYSLLKAESDNGNLKQLGEKIFYDSSLSKNGQISCVSCHNPAMAFTDGIFKSHANTEGVTVSRNSPSLINAVFSDRFFYDLRTYDLEEQAEHVFKNHLEYNTTFTEILSKINVDETYIGLFKTAFKKEDSTITRSQFSAALSSYIISLRSFNSEFDQYVLGKSQYIADDVKEGFNLFMGKANCATCHFAPTFSGLVPPLYRENESEVLGVLKAPNVLQVDTDLGRFENGIAIDQYPIYRNSFKTTTVRNIALTAPYFHNGAYQTIDEVIDFYNQGGAAGMGLSYEVPNQTLPSDKLDLSKKEIDQLKAFLNALTDNPFVDKE